MNTKMLFDAIRNCEDDPRPIILEVRTRKGLFKKVLSGVGFDANGIYLSAGDADELPDTDVIPGEIAAVIRRSDQGTKGTKPKGGVERP